MAVNTIPVSFNNIADLILTEGKPIAGSSFSYSGVASSSRTSFGSSTNVGYGNGIFVTNVQMTVNSAIPVGVQLTINDQVEGSTFETISQVFRNKILNQTINIPVNQYFRNFPVFTGYLENGDGTTTCKIDVNINGTVITDSNNIRGKNTILWVGDSISAMSGLPQNAYAKKYELHTHMVNDLFISKNKDTRLAVVAKGGTNSSQGEIARKSGHFDYVKTPDYFFYHFGANDASQGVSSAVYNANVKSFIDWAKVKNSNAKIIILGITPLANATSNTNAIALRSSLSSYLSGLSLPNVYYCDLANAFDRTVSSNYSSADTVGQGVHPNIAGMAGVYSTISTFLTANGIL